MIQSYKQKYKLAESYDTIIIGSGMGSLAAAAILSKEGQRVLVLERHYTAGGYTHIFKRNGYEWDVGIHYIGEVEKKTKFTRKLFDYISDGELKWADMGDVYDRVVIGDNIYDFEKGVTSFAERMKAYFPDDAEAIDTYINLVFQAAKSSRNYFMEKALPPLISKIAGKRLKGDFLKHSDKTTLEVLEEITDNQELIKVLTAQYGDYGLQPSKSSFAMHAMLVKHYFSGGFFPVGGSGRIVDTIAPVIEKAGGTILVKAEVEELIIERNKAVGVKMNDGKELRADRIISGIGIVNTYNKLMPSYYIQKHNLDQQLQKIEPSVAHVCLYIGLKGSPEALNLPKANYWIYPKEGTHDEIVENYLKDISKPFPVVYISFPAAKDPDWPNRYPGKSTIDIITLMSFEEVKQWELTRWKKRGEDYTIFKENIAQRLLKELYKLEPQLEGKVDYYELSTPLTTKHFVNYDNGEIYGINHTPDRFRLKFLKPQTPIKNLYLTGQDIVTVGIGGALFSGLLTAAVVTRKNLVMKVLNSNF